MKFREARAELAEIAQGNRRSMRYDLTDTKSGTTITRCDVYIASHGWHDAPTWREALNKMRVELGMAEIVEPEPTEAPE